MRTIVKTFILLAVMTLCGYARAGHAGEPPPESGGNYEVYLLVDEQAVMGYGHAALLMGDENGWHYYSFGPRRENRQWLDNLHHVEFGTLHEARCSDLLGRYDKYLHWTSNDPAAAVKARSRVEGEWRGSKYDPLKRNCFHMVADVVLAAGLEIDAKFTTPVSAYAANVAKGREHGAWLN